MNTKIKILESVIKESQNMAISKISTINVAKISKTSEANIYKIFKTKANLLKCAFLYIDEKVGTYIEEKVKEIPSPSLESMILYSKEVWMTYLDFFVNNLSYAVYYSSYRMSRLYSDSISEEQKDHFSKLESMFDFLNQGSNMYSLVSFNLFWSFILDSTLLIAKRMGSKEIEYNIQNIEVSYHLIFDGLLNILMSELKKKQVEVSL